MAFPGRSLLILAALLACEFVDASPADLISADTNNKNDAPLVSPLLQESDNSVSSEIVGSELIGNHGEQSSLPAIQPLASEGIDRVRPMYNLLDSVPTWKRLALFTLFGSGARFLLGSSPLASLTQGVVSSAVMLLAHVAATKLGYKDLAGRLSLAAGLSFILGWIAMTMSYKARHPETQSLSTLAREEIVSLAATISPDFARKIDSSLSTLPPKMVALLGTTLLVFMIPATVLKLGIFGVVALKMNADKELSQYFSSISKTFS